jgi:hypothetical protein
MDLRTIERSPGTILCYKVCQRLAEGRWFSPGTPVSSTNKTDHHDITEIWFKVALNTINQTIYNLTTIRSRHDGPYVFVLLTLSVSKTVWCLSIDKSFVLNWNCWKDLKYLEIIYFFIDQFLVYKIHLQKNHKLHSNLESSRLHSNLESPRLHSKTPLMQNIIFFSKKKCQAPPPLPR